MWNDLKAKSIITNIKVEKKEQKFMHLLPNHNMSKKKE